LLGFKGAAGEKRNGPRRRETKGQRSEKKGCREGKGEVRDTEEDWMRYEGDFEHPFYQNLGTPLMNGTSALQRRTTA
jgi:hypothetical protein